VGLGSAYIYVLVDNYSREGFLSEWGLSLYIESNEWRALFDSGTSGEVLRYNTSRLGIDLTKLDFAFLSHHHGDHYGGFKYVGQVCPSLTVYIPPGGYGYLESWGLRPIVINEPQQISSSAWSTGPLRLCLWGLREHSLVFIIKGKGLVIVVGCSHPGLKVIIDRSINITGVSKVYMVIGGFHEPRITQLDYVASKAEYVAPLHCSGIRAREYLARKYPTKLLTLKAGDKVRI